MQECLVTAFAVVVFSYFYSFSIDHYYSTIYFRVMLTAKFCVNIALFR